MAEEKVPPTSPRKETAVRSPPKKSSRGKIGIAVLAVLVLGFAGKFISDRFSSDGSQPPSPPVVQPSFAELLPPLRENVTVGRIEFGRGDYDAANKALTDADNNYKALPAIAASDTGVVSLKKQLDQLKG